MASAEFVTEVQARELAREYGASPDEIEREIARGRSLPPIRPSRTPNGCTPQRAEQGPAAHWLAADDHAGTVGDEDRAREP
jgi:hypothetical protein